MRIVTAQVAYIFIKRNLILLKNGMSTAIYRYNTVLVKLLPDWDEYHAIAMYSNTIKPSKQIWIIYVGYITKVLGQKLNITFRLTI